MVKYIKIECMGKYIYGFCGGEGEVFFLYF